MKDVNPDSPPHPWDDFREETGGQVVVERTGWFIFKSTKTTLDVPMGKHTMTLSSSDSDSVNSPWWGETESFSGEGDGGYIITCMTVPYRSPKALTFKVYKKRENWFPKIFRSPYVKTGDPVFDNNLRIKGRDIELTEQLFSHAELRKMVSGCLGRQHVSSYIIKRRFLYHRASHHGWAWMESTIVKHIGDETLNELRLVYHGELEDTELLLPFHQLLTKTIESLSAIGCVSESPIYE